MNLEFLVVALIIAKVVDWIFQTQWQAENKTKNIQALLDHCFTYSIITIWILILLGILHIGIVTGIIWIILLISHILIDDRTLVKQIMMLKGLTRYQVHSKEYGWLQIGIDQRLHELTILAIALVI